jgi:hypothetical protein
LSADPVSVYKEAPPETKEPTMKTIFAMMLAAAFLISRPALAGDEAPKAKTEKADKGKDAKKADKTDEKKDEKKADKGGW